MNIFHKIKFLTISFIERLSTQTSSWMFLTATKLVILCVLFSYTYIIINYPQLPPLIPLWMSRAWGYERMAPVYMLFLLPAISLIWHGTNVIILGYFGKNHYVFGQLLYISSIFVGIFSLIFTVNIISIIS